MSPRSAHAVYESPAFCLRVKELREKKVKWEDVALIVNSSFASKCKGLSLRKWWHDFGRKRAQHVVESPHTPQDMEEIAELYSKTWDGHLVIKGDVCIGADFHMPHFHADLTEKMVAMSKKMKIPNLLLLGDFANFESLSRFDHPDPDDTLKRELEACTHLMDMLLKSYKRIYWVLGNHDKRLFRALNFGLDLKQLGSMICQEALKERRLICSGYSFAIINDCWRATHPKSYSRIGGRVPSILADKFRMHVIGAHGHHLGLQVAMDGEHVGIDCGGMFDPAKIRYTQQEDSTHGAWTPAFTIIRNNCAYLFTNNPALTDWGFWLPKKRRKP